MKNVTYVTGKQRYAVRCNNPHGAYVLMAEVNRRFGHRAEYGEPGRIGYIAISESEFREMIAPTSAITAKTESVPVAQIDTSRFGAIYVDWRMRDNICRKRYADWNAASAAYKEKSGDVVGSTTLYQTVTVSVGGKPFTYFSDHGYKPDTMVIVDLPDIGESVVKVVSSAIMSKRDLEKLCPFERFKRIVRKATKKDLEIPDDAQFSRDMAEAFAFPSTPKTYGYGTYTDDDVPW